MKSTVTEVFKTPLEASNAVEELKMAGITEKDISVLMSDATHGKEFDIEQKSKAPEGIAIGATTGGVLGAIAAGMTAVGSVVLTGGAGIVAVGPMVAALAGFGAGAGAGGLVGGLVGLGINENEAKQIEADLDNGSVLVAVETDHSHKSRVKDIMKQAHKRDETRAKTATA